MNINRKKLADKLVPGQEVPMVPKGVTVSEHLSVAFMNIQTPKGPDTVCMTYSLGSDQKLYAWSSQHKTWLLA